MYYNGLGKVVEDMPLIVIGNFCIYCVINAFTPGPGNILALNTVSNYGWKKGKRLFFGIFAGYYAVQAICALIVFTIGAVVPQFMNIVKYIGAAYIIWLAIHIALSKPAAAEGEKSASFLKGFMLQFVNVKIYLFGITALTGFVIGYSTSGIVYLLFSLMIATFGTIATMTWIVGGFLINRFYLKWYRGINLILAVFLLECVHSILK